MAPLSISSLSLSLPFFSVTNILTFPNLVSLVLREPAPIMYSRLARVKYKKHLGLCGHINQTRKNTKSPLKQKHYMHPHHFERTLLLALLLSWDHAGLVFNGGWIQQNDVHVKSLSLDMLTSRAWKFHMEGIAINSSGLFNWWGGIIP